MRGLGFWLAVGTVLVAALAMTQLVANQYYYFAGYVVLQYVVLATAWNILGGYTGYVNFGSAGFFALGAYSAILAIKLVAAPPTASETSKNGSERTLSVPTSRPAAPPASTARRRTTPPAPRTGHRR